MVLLEKYLWDDVVAGPQPDKGPGKFKKISTQPLVIKDGGGESSSSSNSNYYQRSMSMPTTPTTPATPGTPRENVWRSVFNPGSNPATKTVGANYFDKPQQPNSPTVYDWLYSGETRSNHR